MDYQLEPRTPEQAEQLDRRFHEGAGADQGPATSDPWSADLRSRQMHDRDRILYSAAFQRLAHVTQVTAPESGVPLHNRLGHSLKVAQVGRRNAERLRSLAVQGVITGGAGDLVRTIDPDAVEAACLAHDLGHPPFGHIAEEVLQSCASEHDVHDGFEGNAQSFRIVTRLAQRSSGGGLNLTRQTLDGLLKYPWRHWDTDDLVGSKRRRKWGHYAEDREIFRWVRREPGDEVADAMPPQSVEASLMEWADDVTYAVHDVDDFFRAGLVPLDRFGEADSDEMKFFEQLIREADQRDPGSLGATPDELMDVARRLLPNYVPNGPYRHTLGDRREMKAIASDAITKYLSAFRIVNRDDGSVGVSVAEEIDREIDVLKALIRVYVIRRPGLAVVQHGQKRVVEELFRFYLKASERVKGDRRIFPSSQRAEMDAREGDSLEKRVRLVIDLIAGLTENSAIQLHQRLVGGSVAPTLDATAETA